MAVLEKQATNSQLEEIIEYLKSAVRDGYRFYTKDSRFKHSELKRLNFDPANLYSSNAHLLAKSFLQVYNSGKTIYVLDRENVMKKITLHIHIPHGKL